MGGAVRGPEGMCRRAAAGTSGRGTDGGAGGEEEAAGSTEGRAEWEQSKAPPGTTVEAGSSRPSAVGVPGSSTSERAVRSAKND